MQTSQSATSLVRDIVRHLKSRGSPAHAAGVQWFFKEEVRSHGWYTAELRPYARELHRQLAADQALLLEVARQVSSRPCRREVGINSWCTRKFFPLHKAGFHAIVTNDTVAGWDAREDRMVFGPAGEPNT